MDSKIVHYNKNTKNINEKTSLLRHVRETDNESIASQTDQEATKVAERGEDRFALKV